MEETTLTVDYASFNLRQSGYKYSPETPPEINRRLGVVAYRAKVIVLEKPLRIDHEFPWSPEDNDIFELADPIHLIAFRETELQKKYQWIFAIGRPRQHSKGLMIGCLGGREPLGNDSYLPSWVVEPGLKLSEDELEESKGFPAGVGFLVVARQS